MKLLVSLNSKEVDDYLDYTNSFIIGLKDYSINYLEFAENEIEDLLRKYPNMELFVSINKNIFNNDIKKLEEILLRLDKLPLKGVLFYDLSILSLWKKNSLKMPLCWHQTHMVTNYNTCNYYYEKGCKYAYLSSEITESEILEICKKTSMKTMALFMGYPIVSHSKRKLLSNYFEYFNYEKKDEVYKIKSLNSADYFIKETNNGTSILYGNIVNGSSKIVSLKEYIDYAILDEQFIDHEMFIKILCLYNELIKEINDSPINEVLNKINSLIGNDTSFFDKKTIYKVKKNEKN